MLVFPMQKFKLRRLRCSKNFKTLETLLTLSKPSQTQDFISKGQVLKYGADVLPLSLTLETLLLQYSHSRSTYLIADLIRTHD